MQEQIRLPIPDPLGVLGEITRDMPVVLFDPLKDAKDIDSSKQESEVRDGPAKENIIDTKIKNYTYHLEQALKFAPCPGCRNLVISALVGVEIYKMMERDGKTREDFTDQEIQKIKREIEQRYGG